jgi:hypothetical protein
VLLFTMLFSALPALATLAVFTVTAIAGREQAAFQGSYGKATLKNDGSSQGSHSGIYPGDVAGSSGSVETYLGPVCNSKPAGSKKPIIVPSDRCLSTHGFSLRLLTPAVCANGTRAKWARFEGPKCNYGEITFEDGLLDIEDTDLRECKEMGWAGNREVKIGSMSFWCDGFGDVKRPDPNAPPVEEKPKPRAGSVSESACTGKAPFFRHPKTDTCMNLSTQKLKIFSSGICEDGTPGRWAKYEDEDCTGSPSETVDVGDELLERCLNVEGTKSFAFWCTGDGLGSPPKKKKGDEKKSNGGGGKSVVLIIVLTFVGVLALGGVAFLAYAFRDQIQVNFTARLRRCQRLIGFRACLGEMDMVLFPCRNLDFRSRGGCKKSDHVRSLYGYRRWEVMMVHRQRPRLRSWRWFKQMFDKCTNRYRFSFVYEYMKKYHHIIPIRSLSVNENSQIYPRPNCPNLH